MALGVHQQQDVRKTGLYPVDSGIDKLMEDRDADPEIFRNFKDWLKCTTGSDISVEAFLSYIHPQIPDTLVIYAQLITPVAFARSNTRDSDIARNRFAELQAQSNGEYEFQQNRFAKKIDGVYLVKGFVKLFPDKNVNVGVNLTLVAD